MTDRIAWLKDHLTQMGHHDLSYQKWELELSLLQAGLDVPDSHSARQRLKRRLKAHQDAGYPLDKLPNGLVYAHGQVMSEQEKEHISDCMEQLGDAKPKSGKSAYFRLADEFLQQFRATT